MARWVSYRATTVSYSSFWRTEERHAVQPIGVRQRAKGEAIHSGSCGLPTAQDRGQSIGSEIGTMLQRPVGGVHTPFGRIVLDPKMVKGKPRRTRSTMPVPWVLHVAGWNCGRSCPEVTSSVTSPVQPSTCKGDAREDRGHSKMSTFKITGQVGDKKCVQIAV